jgi:2-oxoglutarate dehydrogenase E1 component
MKTKFRKPLIVFTPKSLLRDSRCVSTIEEFENGSFQETIDDAVNKADVKTLVFCKFYYELTAEREKNERKDVAIVRIEQLFPLPAQLKEIIAKYPNADDYVWAQEEPKKHAYSFMLMNFNLVKWRLASLKAYSASASGSSTRAKRRMADAIRMVLIKIYLIIRSYFLILKPRASTKLKVGAAFSVRAKNTSTK